MEATTESLHVDCSAEVGTDASDTFAPSGSVPIVDHVTITGGDGMPSYMVICTYLPGTFSTGANMGCSGPPVEAPFCEPVIVTEVTHSDRHISECYLSSLAIAIIDCGLSLRSVPNEAVASKCDIVLTTNAEAYTD